MTACNCGKTWTGKRLEHCTACHETFTGTTAGDKHRTGDYFPSTRRCLTPDEMRGKGMAQNDRGVWTNGGTSPWATPTTHPDDATCAAPTSDDCLPVRVEEDQ